MSEGPKYIYVDFKRCTVELIDYNEMAEKHGWPISEVEPSIVTQLASALEAAMTGEGHTFSCACPLPTCTLPCDTCDTSCTAAREALLLYQAQKG